MEHMEPIRSRSSKFVERYAQAEVINNKLTLSLIAVSVVSLGLLWALVAVSFKPRSIYYIPGAWSAGVAEPQASEQSLVSSFVLSWVLNWTNFTPVTAMDIYVRAQRFMSPHLLAQTKARLERDIDDVKKNSMSSIFSVIQEPVVVVEGSGFLVTIQGDKGAYMGKEELKTQRMVYQIRVRKVNQTDNNPYGLMIESIDQEVK